MDLLISHLPSTTSPTVIKLALLWTSIYTEVKSALWGKINSYLFCGLSFLQGKLSKLCLLKEEGGDVMILLEWHPTLEILCSLEMELC